MITSGRQVDERVEALSLAAKWGNSAAAAEAMAGAGPAQWLAVDAAVRGRRELPDSRRAAGIALRALARDGHVREAAVAEIERLEDRLALPVLAIRASDRVPQVRDRARQACLGYLARDPLLAVTLVPLASMLRARAHGEWLASILDRTLAHRPEVRAAALVSRERVTRRAAHAAGGLDQNQVRTGLLDTDVPIRLNCARTLAGSADPQVRRLLRTSSTAAVRALAVRSRDDALAMLADRNGLVRAQAQVVVRGAGEDPAEYYRKLSGRGAIAGLGETGVEADAPALVPFLDDRQPRVRVEAIRALRRLHSVPRQKLVALLVSDPSPRVARQAMFSLLGCAEQINKDLLVGLLDGDRRHLAHRLLRARGTGSAAGKQR